MRLFSILLLLFCFYSCSNPTPDFTTVHIEEVVCDSLQTIRDVQARDRANIWFSAGEGRVGVLQGGVPKIASVRYKDRKSTRLNSSHVAISYAVFCLKNK